MGLMTQRHSTVSKIGCSVVGDKTRLTHTVEDIIGYFWPLALQCRVHPGATCRALGAHCHYPTLSYKRLGQAPFSMGLKTEKAQARQA
jgi:hypothetical protein